MVTIGSPDGRVREGHLASIAPRDDVAVLEYTGDHFNTFMKQAAPILPDVSNCDGVLEYLLSLPSLTIDSPHADFGTFPDPDLRQYSKTERRSPSSVPALFFKQVVGVSWSVYDFTTTPPLQLNLNEQSQYRRQSTSIYSATHTQIQL